MKKILLFLLALVGLTAQAWATGGTLEGTGTQEDPYQIADAQDWAAFASKVNGGETSACAVLTADITEAVSAMVGTDANRYGATFDGAGHTLTVGIEGADNEMGVAPFRYVCGATIRNLQVAGTVTAHGYHASGLLGMCSGTNDVYCCGVSANVVANGYAGGIVGHGGGGMLMMAGCYYSGTISDFTEYAGGLLGWCDDLTMVITDCLFSGSFSPFGAGEYHPVVCTYATGVEATVHNVYHLNTLTPTVEEEFLVPGTDGTRVSATLIDGEWDEAVTLADGGTYYVVPTIRKGDMDGDGKVTLADVTQLVNKLLGKIVLVTGITLSQTHLELEGSDDATLTATFFPSCATDKRVSWTSSDKDVATVDENGWVRAIWEGECTIICTALDGSGVSATCTVHVSFPSGYHDEGSPEEG